MSTKQLMSFNHPGRASEVTSVEDYIQAEFDTRGMGYSCSDTTDQSNRIDYLETLVAMLCDKLVQSGALSGEDVLALTYDDYRTSQLRMVDEEK